MRILATVHSFVHIYLIGPTRAEINLQHQYRHQDSISLKTQTKTWTLKFKTKTKTSNIRSRDVSRVERLTSRELQD